MPRRISIVAAARRYIVKLTPQKAYWFMAEANKRRTWRLDLNLPTGGQSFCRGKVNATSGG
jgi:hypothetical protein